MMVLMAHKSASGEVLRLSTISRDITERKQMEEDLRLAKAQAEAANEAKSGFLANMSHEIRTPLNAIIGFSEILACEGLSDEQTEWVRTIRDSGEHLLELISDILDFSKIEAGKLDLEMIEYSLENLCAKVESLMRPAAMKKGLEFGFRENGVLPARIRTDPMRLSQCLLNLVGNAVKFTEKGHVYVNISLEEVDDEPCIRFDVEDTGIGIPLEKQQLIFESFTQADGSTTRRFGGSGLGLAITKRLAGLLGGRVSLTSEEGKGSVFSLVVPVGVGLTEQAPSDGRELADGSSVVQSISAAPDRRSRGDAEFKFTGRAPRGRALVAEDAVTNQMLIKLMLERMGLEVTMVKDGAEAVREGLAQSYDLIFMDIQMPNMNGYEAARRLRKKGLTTPIIALTANAMEGDEKKCIEAGCDDYLPKPIERAKLMEITRKYLTPEPQDLSERIDSVKSGVDDLGRLCSKDAAPQADSADADSAQDVIDWDQLISRVVEEDIAREIVPLCVEDNRERLEMLAAAVQAGNAQNVKLYAHAIKGSAANTGATRLSQVAHRLEYMAYRDDLSQAEQLLQEIRAEFGRFESFVSQPDWVEAAKGRQAGKQPQ
jgi:CheY-like chemotaxis protein/HPt (histidine-containing phosphotransfer) domain-containing protein